MNRIIISISLLAAVMTIGDVTWKIISNQNYNITAVIIVIFMIMLFQSAIWIIMETKVDPKDKYIPFIIYLYIPLVVIASLIRYFKLSYISTENPDLVFSEAINLSIMIISTVVLYIFWSTVFKTTFHKNKTIQGVVFGITASSVIGMIIYLYIMQNKVVDSTLWGFILLAFVLTLMSAVIGIAPINIGKFIKKKN